MSNDAPIVETVDTIEEEGGLATNLVVLGGPEDGRLLNPTPQAIIGRAGGTAQIELYRHTRLTDRKMSRAHVRWEGAGRLFALQRVWIRSARSLASAPVIGECELSIGDELAFSEGTRVIGVGGKPIPR